MVSDAGQDDLHSRVAVMETEMEHMADQMKSMSGKVDDIHKMFVKLDGAKTFGLAIIGAVVFFAGNDIVKAVRAWFS